PMARLPSLKSESCSPEASKCSRWVVSLRISSRVAVCITCASRNAPAWSLLGGYSLDVSALETVYARQVIRTKTAAWRLRNPQPDGWQFAWPCLSILVFLIEPLLSGLDTAICFVIVKVTRELLATRPHGMSPG